MISNLRIIKYLYWLMLIFTIVVSSCKNRNASIECETVNCGKYGYCKSQNHKAYCSCDIGYQSKNLKCVKESLKKINIIDLIDRNKIMVKANGAGIKNILLNIQKLEKNNFNIIVPIGTYFLANNAFMQNMISIKRVEIIMDVQKKNNILIPVACTNLKKKIPIKTTFFSIKETSDRSNLDSLILGIKNKKLSYSIVQAAIWLITDNARYRDLSRLTTGFSSLNNVIDDVDMVKAMQLCDGLGFSVKRMAIAKDRQLLIEHLKDEDLKKWLKSTIPRKTVFFKYKKNLAEYKNKSKKIIKKPKKVWIYGKPIDKCMGNNKVINKEVLKCTRGYYKEVE